MRLVSTIYLFFLGAFLFGCSNNVNPVEVPSGNACPEPFEYHPVPIISHSVAGVMQYQVVFGIWNISIDANLMTAEVIPPRNASAIGNIFDADLTQFLEVSPCANCLNVDNIYIDGYGNLNVSFRMKHPFNNIAARPDLHGFDVRGIFISKSVNPSQIYPDIKVIKPDGTEEEARIASNFVLNADGYTSHFDEIPTDSRYFVGGQDLSGNLNPFLRFFEDYSTPQFDPSNPAGQNVMKVGGTSYARTAVFNMGEPYNGQLKFYFVADVAYGQSAVLANRKNPQYYLPAFHRTEPWRVEYWIENNNLNPFDPSSTADLIVQVFDWQHNAAVDSSYPNPSNLGGVPESSKVAQVELSIPGFQDSLIVMDTPEAGNGIPQDPLRYRLKITNAKQSFTNQAGLLAVRDELHGMAAPHGRLPIPQSPAGFPYETLDIRDYSLYQIVYVNLGVVLPIPNAPNVFGLNELIIPFKNQVACSTPDGPKTVIYPEFFMDPGHKLFQYRWDYDYDGVTFNIDGAGAPSPEIVFSSPGRKQVGLRIRTNSVPPREFIYTIPVYAEGEIPAEEIVGSFINIDSTSDRQNHAIAATSDNFYLPYVREVNNQRDIWLATWDRFGNLRNVPVTDTPEADFYPVVTVGGSPNPAVHLAYTTKVGGDMYIYTVKGNLNGSGFSAPKRLTNDVNVMEIAPVIFFQFSKLKVVYTMVKPPSPFTYKIYGATSDDGGDTWVENGWLVNNGSSSQYSPTAVAWSVLGTATLVWVDLINSATRGSDLYLATGTTTGTWFNIRNISNTHDKTNDTAPTITYSYGNLAIAYLSNPEGSTDSYVRVKFIDSYNYDDMNIFDYKVHYNSTSSIYNHSYPSISTDATGNFIVSYGAYHKQSGKPYLAVVKLETGRYLNDIKETKIYDIDAGSVPENGQNLMPNVVCFSPHRNFVETFVVYKDFSQGHNESPIVPSMYFGNIKSCYFSYFVDVFVR